MEFVCRNYEEYLVEDTVPITGPENKNGYLENAATVLEATKKLRYHNISSEEERSELNIHESCSALDLHSLNGLMILCKTSLV